MIGGASGAMPPVLGWAAVRGDAGPEAGLLCHIIFLWTPPHFWALALYRAEDYRQSGLPMLPITHGNEFTRLHVFLYTIVLFAGTLLPSSMLEGHTVRAFARVPGPLVALVTMTALVWWPGWPVETIGQRFGGIPRTLPELALPAFSWESAKQLVIPTITIALLGAP